MKTKQHALTILAAVMVASLAAPHAAMAARSYVFTLKGEGTVRTDYPGYEGHLCYTGVDLYDTATGAVVGDGVDCLSEPTTYPSGDFPPPFPTDTVMLDRTTILNTFKGTVVMHGRTTVAPIPEFGEPGVSPDITHIVGDISEPGNANHGNIKAEEGTGAFAGLTGSARLSGAVNMVNFGATPEEFTMTGKIVFNCIFVVTFDDPAVPIVFQHGRFLVEVAWKDHSGHTGEGLLVSQTDDSGTLYFFDADNWEVQIKVLDGCGFNGHYWVFLAATTDVEFTVTVTDTTTDEVWEVTNPLGHPADAVTDTSAFATCP